MLKKILSIWLLVLLFLASCLKEPQNPQWEISVLAPLFKSDLGIQNFFADSLMESDSNLVLHIVYRNTLYDFMPDSILETPDTITFQAYQSPIIMNLQPGQLFINKTEEKVYKFGNSKITQLKIKEGYLLFSATNSLSESVLMTYSIPSAKKNGQSFEMTELIPALSTGANEFSKRIDISGYSLDLRGSSGLGANTLSTNIKARLNPNGHATQITNTDNFNTLVKFDEFVIGYIRGYFESVEIDVDDESKMDVFSIISSGNIDFENINLDLIIENGFGIDAQMKINEIISKNTVSGLEVPLHTPILGQSINIMRASETGNDNHPVNSTYYPIDFTYSNVKQMLENQPDRLIFNLSGLTNPLGNISGGNDFYYDGYGLKIILNLDIPLSLKATALTLSETFDFEMSEPENKNFIIQGTFKLIADNGFPFDALVQLFLLDENDTLLDSLLFNNLALAAPLNSSGIVESVNRTVMEAPMPPEKLDKLFLTKKMNLRIVFDTHSSEYIKIYDFYRIGLKLTGDFDFMVQQ
ncbi:MAG: hypothetical protein PHT69_01850 [Bacteroidales bacterium]|nr:hypothetical protein [Bacteroidales bacterium]